METIGQRLKALRKELKLRSRFVAKEALGEETPFNLLNYEADRAKPSPEKTKLLANFYGRDVNYIMYGAEVPDTDKKTIENVFEDTIYYDNKIITQYEKDFLINTLKMLRNKD